MPKENSGGQDKGARNTRGQPQENRDGSYSPEWLKRSRDDVPQTGKPVRQNPVVEAIMANGSPGNEQAEQPKQAPAESEG